MKSRLLFSEHNFCLVDFFNIYSQCEIELINNLHAYGLLEKPIAKDTKALILHHLILQICNTVLECKGKEKNIIYFYNSSPTQLKIFKYFDKTKIEHLFCKTIDKLENILPIRVYRGECTFNDLNKNCLGKKAELIAKIKQAMDNADFSKFTFSKIYSFTRRYNLTFLNKDYFNTIKARQLLIT